MGAGLWLRTPAVGKEFYRAHNAKQKPTVTARSPDFVGIDATRRRLEEDAAGLAQQPAGSAQHDRRDDQRGDPVGLMEADSEDQDACDHGDEERE